VNQLQQNVFRRLFVVLFFGCWGVGGVRVSQVTVLTCSMDLWCEQ